MRISDKGLDIIKQFEGLRLQAYRCLPSETYLTIGYGHYGADVRLGQTITKAQAEEMLKADMSRYEDNVNYHNERYNYNFNQNEFDALVSFCYNIGSINQLTNNGKRTKIEIADKMLLYVNSGNIKNVAGLVKRRKLERELFLTPITPAEPLESVTDHININVPKPVIKKGSKGENVKHLQLCLNAINRPKTPLVIDGSCGAKTVTQIKAFQRTHTEPNGTPLEVDGSFGAKTYSAMCKAMSE